MIKKILLSIFLFANIAAAQSTSVKIWDGGDTAQVTSSRLDTNAYQGGSWTNACTQSGTWNIGTVTTVTGPVPASQSGTWTVQPGNTANTTAWKVDGSAVTQPVSGTVTCNAGTNLNTSALATSANQTTELGYLDGVEGLLGGLNTGSNFDSKIGSLTETAPATDTASSGLNGRLQRIAQRITSLIALVPSALTGSGNFKVSLQETNVTQPVSVTEGNQPFTAPKINNAGDVGQVVIPKQARFVVSDTAETSSTTTVINATSHSARPGDILEFITGTAANIGVEFEVASTTTNTITVKGTLPGTPANGNVFIIQRPATAALTTAASTHGHGQYCAIDSTYGGITSTTPYHADAGDAAAGDVGMGLVLQGRPNDSEYVGPTSRDKYIYGQGDQDGLIAVTIDGQIPQNGIRGSTCVESSGAASPTLLVSSGGQHVHIRKISCRNSNKTDGSQLKFSFSGGGGGGTEIWNGGIANLSNGGSNGAGSYDSGVMFPPLRGNIDDDFYFETVELGAEITCCALWYKSAN